MTDEDEETVVSENITSETKLETQENISEKGKIEGNKKMLLKLKKCAF